LWGEVLGVNKLRIRRPYEKFRDASEEARLLNELINIVGNVDSILIIAERHGKNPPSVFYGHLFTIALANSMILPRSVAALLERRQTTYVRSFYDISRGFSRRPTHLEVIEDDEDICGGVNC